MVGTYYMERSVLVPYDPSEIASHGYSTLITEQGRIAYRWDGPEDGELIVMIHGFSFPSTVFDKIVPDLTAAGYRVLRFDHFGRGLSDRLDTTADLPFFYRTLNSICEQLEIEEPFHLVGYSLGGGIAAQFTVQQPDRIGRLVLVAPAGLDDQYYKWRFLLHVPVLNDWLAMVGLKNRLVKTIQKEFSIGNVTAAMADSYESQFKIKGTRKALLSTLQHFPLGGLDETYRELSTSAIPLCLIWGIDDKVVPYQQHKKFRQILPEANFKELPGGHGIPYTHAKDLGRIILDFLTLN